MKLNSSLYAPLRTDSTRFGLIAERIDDFRAWTNECESSLLNLARELGIFGEETVTSFLIAQPAKEIGEVYYR